MLVHVLGDVRDVEIGVALIRELLELRVEGFLSEVRQWIKVRWEMEHTRAKLTS
jgi:hypothetical protein